MTLNVLILKMEEQQIGGPDIMEMLHNANEISEQMFTLLDNLLKWTRSQLGKLEAVPQSINLAELAEGVVEVSSMIADTKKIKIKLSINPR